MDAVILFSHGSLLCGSGIALNGHAQRLLQTGVAPIVEVGYLNYSTPAFQDTVASVVSQGATSITVVPYFLIPGKFVQVDLPRAVSKASELYPDVTFRTAEAIGFDTRLGDALIESAENAAGSACWRIDLAQATSSCLNRQDCPLFGTELCSGKAQPADGTQWISTPSFGRDSLVVMVHGSPRPEANEAMYRVVDVVRQRNIFHTVEVGFMECNSPTIPEAISTCIHSGAETVTAVPYFLHTGTHVADDLPTILEESIVIHPGIQFRMGRFLGCASALTDILLDRLTQKLQPAA